MAAWRHNRGCCYFKRYDLDRKKNNNDLQKAGIDDFGDAIGFGSNFVPRPHQPG